MTSRQKTVFDFIRVYWAEHGFGPTYQEIRDALGLVSRSAPFKLVQRLEERGYIRIAYRPDRATAQPRGIIPIFPRARAA